MARDASTNIHDMKHIRHRRFAILAFISLFTILELIHVFTSRAIDHEQQLLVRQAAEPQLVLKTESRKLVPLEAHIMSKCPDARDCMRKLVLPVMENVSDKVNFTLSFIGRTTNHDDGVECKHGPSECLGNIIELCTASLYPDPKIYLGFAMCLEDDFTHIPEREFVTDCALEHGVDFRKLNDCASREDGAYGMSLLKGSVERTHKAGVERSCTVRLNDEIRCIRDGGEWKHCGDGETPESLVHDINKLFDALN